MNTYGSEFFSDLEKMDAQVEINEYNYRLMTPSDGLRLRVSELHRAGKISDAFITLTQDFVDVLAKRSSGRYILEKNFRAKPHWVYSFSQCGSARKQLYVGFVAYPHTYSQDALFPCPWGVSIGLGFDFRNEQGIITECVNEYEAFFEKVYTDPELFDSTFGPLWSHAESTTDFQDKITAETVLNTTVDISQSWLFFGIRLSPKAITDLGSLECFADECIHVFDVICEAGY